uniref:Uncharacterized protein n=1 Tax=Rhizophora mucronata TaxID=61149 RepID=A0A2P2QRD0_RHIMU
MTRLLWSSFVRRMALNGMCLRSGCTTTSTPSVRNPKSLGHPESQKRTNININLDPLSLSNYCQR